MFLHIFGRVSKRKRSGNQFSVYFIIKLGFIGTDVKGVSGLDYYPFGFKYRCALCTFSFVLFYLFWYFFTLLPALDDIINML